LSEIFFFDYNKNQNVLKGIEDLFYKSKINKAISKGDSVAVKTHMGERGNITYIRPIFIQKIVEIIKEIGGNPFVTDTTALYPGNRFTAHDYLKTATYHGFTQKTVGAPIIIADGEKGYNGVLVPIKKTVNGCKLKEIKIASAFTQADTLIVVSHAKGHELSGFGGAIKNVAMGCATKEGKASQHTATRAVIDYSKCDGCGKCVEVCPFDALTIVEGRPIQNLKKCMSCNSCLSNCPSKALYMAKGAKELFQVNLAHAAFAALSLFKKGRVGYFNFIQDVTPLCDCCAPAGNPIVKNVGILASRDPVAIDRASIDLIDRAQPISTSVKPPDRLGKINGTNSLIQMRTAKKLGLGTMRYHLTKNIDGR